MTLGPLSTAQALLRWAVLIVLAAGATAALGPSSVWSVEPEIVARVNGEPVTRAELQRILTDPVTRQQLQQELGVQEPDSKDMDRLALKKLINRRLALQEAGQRNLTVTEQELDQAITTLRRRFGDLKSFGAWMKERGLDDRSLFETIRTEMLVSRVRAALVEGVRLTEEQVKEYYESHRADLKTAGDVRLRVIAVRDKAAAEEILALLQKGTDFGAMARARSMGMRAAQGGDIGWVDPRTLPPTLQKAVGAMKTGETRGPLRKGEDFLIVRLVGRRPPRTKSLAEARPELERRLLPAKQQEVFQAWLAEQEKNSKIELFL
jgi:parvulin-like peptidyl-prolyl isomerase